MPSLRPSALPITSLPFILTTILTLLLSTSCAQSTSTPPSPTTQTPQPQLPATRTSSTASASVTIHPGQGAYTYIGCYNETTDRSESNARALSPARMQGNDAMSATLCFSFCGNAQYAGLEYARECWCGPYLNSQADKLPDAECGFACLGQKGEACGGSLKLTLYNRSSVAATRKSDAAAARTLEESRRSVTVGGVMVALCVVFGLDWL